MAQPLEHVFSPCSTRSSGSSLLNADLVPETLPAARVAEVNAVDSSSCGTSQQSTVVDPDLCSLGQRLEMSLPQDKDPFVTPVRGTRLSPTASTFTPGTESDTFMSLDSMVPFANALSSKLGLSRILWVSSDNTTSVSEIEHWLSMMEVSCGGRLYGTRRLAMRGPGVEIAFTDLRDSIRVKENFDSAQTNHSAEFVSSRHDFSETTGSKAESAERGQVLITASWLSSLGPHEKYVPEVITSFLERYGRLFALANRTFSSDGAFQAVAEFCNVDAAVCAIRTCRDGIAFMGFNMIVEPWTREAQSEAQGASLFPKMSTPTIDFNDGIPPRGTEAKEIHQTSKTHRAPAFAMYPFMFSPQFPGGAPFMMDTYSSNAQSVPMGPFAPMTPLSPGFSMMRSIYHSPPSPAMTSQYSSSPSKASSAYARPDVRRQGATRVTRSAYGTGNHHNHVDTARIREGIDVRTTIMLRNIPNKVDQAMLKRLVDESSWGKYDFMYLRIDFANDCNVGYAFINFVDPLDIVDFVEARGNQRWNCFKSDKVAEISYATIQGKDCLVQKFRNSSVMLEAPHYRPKLYFTSNGPMPELAGQEEPFPEPDNQSKMKRSCENAEHVGLFTPNAGQHFRDEQRRRRSQYDRGTRLAALEEYDYDAAVNHLCGAD